MFKSKLSSFYAFLSAIIIFIIYPYQILSYASKGMYGYIFWLIVFFIFFIAVIFFKEKLKKKVFFIITLIFSLIIIKLFIFDLPYSFERWFFGLDLLYIFWIFPIAMYFYSALNSQRYIALASILLTGFAYFKYHELPYFLVFLIAMSIAVIIKDNKEKFDFVALLVLFGGFLYGVSKVLPLIPYKKDEYLDTILQKIYANLSLLPKFDSKTIFILGIGGILYILLSFFPLIPNFIKYAVNYPLYGYVSGMVYFFIFMNFMYLSLVKGKTKSDEVSFL